MAQINPPKSKTPSQSHEDLREDQLQTVYAHSSVFFDKYRTQVIGGAIAVVVLLAGVIGYNTWRSSQAAEAQQLLGAILNEYQQGNYDAALDGTDTTPGLLEIADQYGSLPSGRQATFLAADALFQLGRMEEAMEMFKAYKGDGLLKASALAGQGAILEPEKPAEAAAMYESAAKEDPTEASAPGYLLDAARAYAAAGEAEKAQSVLQRVIDEFDEAPEAMTAQIEIGRVTAMAQAVGQATGGVQPAPAAAVSDSTAAE